MGSGFIDQLSKDLRAEFPELGEFSKDNLHRIKKAYLVYSQYLTKVAQLVGELQPQLFMVPWGHHVLIVQKTKDFTHIVYSSRIYGNFKISIFAF